VPDAVHPAHEVVDQPVELAAGGRGDRVAHRRPPSARSPSASSGRRAGPPGTGTARCGRPSGRGPPGSRPALAGCRRPGAGRRRGWPAVRGGAAARPRRRPPAVGVPASAPGRRPARPATASGSGGRTGPPARPPVRGGLLRLRSRPGRAVRAVDRVRRQRGRRAGAPRRLDRRRLGGPHLGPGTVPGAEVEAHRGARVRLLDGAGLTGSVRVPVGAGGVVAGSEPSCGSGRRPPSVRRRRGPLPRRPARPSARRPTAAASRPRSPRRPGCGQLDPDPVPLGQPGHHVQSEPL
jgi:hypothetical protein